MAKGKGLWEILVPKYSNTGEEYSLEHHRAWDEKIKEIAGGITVLKTAKGQWIDSQGRNFKDEMIPVRIYCSEESIDKIIEHTLVYYAQEAIMAYEISSRVKLVEKKNGI